MDKDKIIYDLLMEEGEKEWLWEMTHKLLNTRHSVFFLKVISYNIQRWIEYENKKWLSEATYDIIKLAEAINNKEDIAKFNENCSWENFSKMIEKISHFLPKDYINKIITKFKNP